MSDSLPSSSTLEAEEAVLGCVLMAPEAFFDVAFLRAEDFYRHTHRWVWEAIVSLHQQELPVDTLTLSTELERRQQLAEIGGTAFLARLLTSVPTSLHAEAYARLVESAATRRRLMDAATAIAKLALMDDRNVADVVADAEATLLAVSERRGAQASLTLSGAAEIYAARVEQADAQAPGVDTGLPELNAVLGGGVAGSNLMLVAGRPGAGKTSFMLSVARCAAQRQQRRVAIFSGEMSHGELVERFIAQETGLNPLRVRRGLFTLAEREQYQAALAELARWPLTLFALSTVEQLRAECLRLAQREGLDVVIVDYLQQAQSASKHANREQEVAHVARQLKQLAQELDVPVLAGAQLSRAVEQRADKRPVLSDLRESGAQEQDADEVLFLHTVTEGPHALMELILAKHRHGATHPGVRAGFAKPRFLFQELDPP